MKRCACSRSWSAKPTQAAAVHLEYGYLLDSLSREGQAIVQYTKALALGLSPDDRVNCLICLASSYRNRKRFDEALSTIERAAAEYPDNQVVVCFHALILSELGRAEEGLARLENGRRPASGARNGAVPQGAHVAVPRPWPAGKEKTRSE